MENMDPEVAGLVDEVNNMMRAKLRGVKSALIANLGYAALGAIASAAAVIGSLDTSGSTSALLFVTSLGTASFSAWCFYEVAKGASWLWVFRNFERDINK